MERIEKPRGLLPWYAVSLAVSVTVCLAMGYRGWTLVGGLIGFFLAAYVCLWLLLLVFLVVLALAAGPVRERKRRDTFYNAVVCYVLGLVTALGRIRVRVSGLDQLPAGRWLLVCNHRSNYDPLITGWLLRKREFAFITKPSVMRNFVSGRLVSRACYLGIDRENDRAALRTILEAARLLKEDVVSFGIYPEGTRHAGDEMLPFRNGAFKIAQRAKVSVVAAAIRGTDAVHRNFPWRSTEVQLKICAVMDAETVCALSTVEIGDQVRTCINSALS